MAIDITALDATATDAVINSRVPYDDYAAVQATNISRLKELKRSAQHYLHYLAHGRESDALTLGIAGHVATLEPSRFADAFAVWTKRTKSDAMSPRKGEEWETFCADNEGRTILTVAERDTAFAIAKAVHSNEPAMRYLGVGDPEVSMRWVDAEARRPCKGRVDWMTTVDGADFLVGLKTARDCRHYQFANQAAKLGYHLQWAFYFDGYYAITGRIAKLVEIVVESKPPHAVAVYRIPHDIIEQGRDEYRELLATLTECERTKTWPGPVPTEEDLSLPTWVYEAEEDISDLGLQD